MLPSAASAEQKWAWLVMAVPEMCPNEHCVFLIHTGGEKPLCPFRHCLKPEVEKHDKIREEAVK